MSMALHAISLSDASNCMPEQGKAIGCTVAAICTAILDLRLQETSADVGARHPLLPFTPAQPEVPV
jgi:hypothetical protein